MDNIAYNIFVRERKLEKAEISHAVSFSPVSERKPFVDLRHLEHISDEGEASRAERMGRSPFATGHHDPYKGDDHDGQCNIEEAERVEHDVNMTLGRGNHSRAEEIVGTVLLYGLQHL